MLSGAGFRDHALLAHALRQQSLADAVIDLMGARVIQIFSLEINLSGVPVSGQSLGMIERRGPARIIPQQMIETRVKPRIVLRFPISRFQFFQRMHERFGDILPAVHTKMTVHMSPLTHT